MDQELYTLIRNVKQGNKEAFRELIQRYKGHVFRQAYAMLHDRMEAEDVSQEVFLKVYRSLDQLESEYAFSSWITKIIFNLCYDRIQKNKKDKSIPFEEIEEINVQPQMEKEMDQIQVRLTVEQAMQELSPDQRAVIILRDLQGFSYGEMADILHIPVGTVKSRIHTARLALRNQLNNKGDDKN